jgi:predicted nucleic acid-binding protein
VPFPNEVGAVEAGLVMWDTCTILRYFFQPSFPQPALPSSVFDELRQLLQSGRVIVSSIVLWELASKISAVHANKCVDGEGRQLRSEEDWLDFLEGHGAVVEKPGVGCRPVNLATSDQYDAGIAGHAKHSGRVLYTLDKKIRGCDSVTTRLLNI